METHAKLTQERIDDFLRIVYPARSIKTRDAYKAALQKFMNIVGDHAPLTEDTYINFLNATSDVSPATQALYRSAVRRFYRHNARTDPSIDISFFDAANGDYALGKPKNFVNPDMDGIRKTIEYVNTIRNTPEELRDRTYILLLADSGLRVSEACSLVVSDVDLLEGRVFVTGKGDKPANVHISSRTIDAMREYFQVRPVLRSTPVFLRHDKRAGDAIIAAYPSYMWHYVKRRITEAGVNPDSIRPHDFRHFFVTTVYQAKGIKLAQKLARHERIGTTDRYTHLVEDEGEAYNEIFNK